MLLFQQLFIVWCLSVIEIHSSAYRRASFALALGSFLVFCNLYLFQPLLPVMTEAFSVSATKVNWLLAAGTLALALTLVPWAVSSEMIGRRKVMLLSLFLLPVVGVLMLLAESLLMLSLAGTDGRLAGRVCSGCSGLYG